MTIKYHPDLIQGTEEWFAARRGILTASEMDMVITPKLKVADNKDVRTHAYELAAQRTTGYVEPSYVSDAMLRGQNDEMDAKQLYNQHYAPLESMGFVTNDKWGFTIGFSPDALLVGRKQAVECKSRCQKYQFQTIVDDEMPDDYKIQVQTGMLVAELEWIDFISYCGGMHMLTKRIYPDAEVQAAIVAAAAVFEAKVKEMMEKYGARLAAEGARLIPTERKIEEKMI